MKTFNLVRKLRIFDILSSSLVDENMQEHKIKDITGAICIIKNTFFIIFSFFYGSFSIILFRVYKRQQMSKIFIEKLKQM